MPIYQLVHSGVPLTFAKRDRLARGITEIHHSETRAPEPFVRVAFEPLPLGTIYTAGEISPSVILNCGIRAGRSDDTRRRIIQRCYDLISDVTNVPPDQIVIAVQEVPCSWIMEAGFFMPEPTDEAEAAWIRGLQEAYPGKYDGWGGDGRRPATAHSSSGHGHALLELAREMVEQAAREGVAAADVLGPLAKLVTQQLAAATEARGSGQHAVLEVDTQDTRTHAKSDADYAVGSSVNRRTVVQKPL